MVRLSIVFLFILFLVPGKSPAQRTKPDKENRTVFGIQISPILPNSLIEKNKVLLDFDTTVYEFVQRPGILFGMEVRHDFTKWLALQTGINLLKRNYRLTVTHFDSVMTDDLGLICYETPVAALIYIRLSKYIYMNTSYGLNLTYFPSDLAIRGKLLAMRYSWIRPALLINLGWELRTEKAGFFYLGCSYSRMFTDVYRIAAKKPTESIGDYTLFEERGSYFSVNIKYFFPSGR
ncbi:MAG: hypothetical protein KJ607_04735 [Bacteroidetes bacterium]|nr:hypothetical protein [Bacteroidota bacterium]